MAETPKIEWPDATWIGTLTPTCPRCFGRGYTVLSSRTVDCPDCNGRGVLMPSVRDDARVAKERDELRAEVERLREALGWFLDDERFHVAVGGNPNVVQKMIHDARLLYIGTLPEVKE